MSLSELEAKVQNLSPEELRAFAQWVEEYTATLWDEQFVRDVTAGKLDKAGRKADAALDAGQCTSPGDEARDRAIDEGGQRMEAIIQGQTAGLTESQFRAAL